MTEPFDIDHDAIVARSLAMLGIGQLRSLDCEVLAGGASGSSTYRLRLSSGPAVLKVTLPDSPPHLRAGARREVLFYRHLAPDVPVRVPTVIASQVGDVGVAILLEAHDPVPTTFSHADAWYLGVAERLARFHAAFWRDDQRLATFRWLRRTAITRRDIQRARSLWERLRDDGRFRSALTSERFGRTRCLLGHIEDDDPMVAAFPRTLCHGDFHLDNLLVDAEGEIVVADWQETGPGLGPEDLGFFLQRAIFSGKTPPREAMIDAYAHRLRALVGEDLPTETVRRVMDLAELRTRLVHWPAFIDNADQLADLLDRIDALADALDHEPRNA